MGAKRRSAPRRALIVSLVPGCPQPARAIVRWFSCVRGVRPRSTGGHSISAGKKRRTQQNPWRTGREQRRTCPYTAVYGRTVRAAVGASLVMQAAALECRSGCCAASTRQLKHRSPPPSWHRTPLSHGSRPRLFKVNGGCILPACSIDSWFWRAWWDSALAGVPLNLSLPIRSRSLMNRRRRRRQHRRRSRKTQKPALSPRSLGRRSPSSSQG